MHTHFVSFFSLPWHSSSLLSLSLPQLSSCDQTLFRMTPRSRSGWGWGGGDVPSQTTPAGITITIRVSYFPISGSVSSVMLAAVFAEYIGERRIVHGCIWRFQGDSSVGAEAGSWGDAGGLILYSMFPVVLEWAENNITLQLGALKNTTGLCLLCIHPVEECFACTCLSSYPA